ncbi:putative serine/threonine-protein kinase iks1 [Ophidiomyces ophidiicola]|uniref:Serine/threonine-protein kinase iks1 n=1 Tax=Ophidiomyces ophidiicola TaxID=1387563 RepID=A0ACB8USU5_9EURO|nr:putative serine/threonine-protein kinase iks1 [Ophidiomyces ophidiicola]KAI1916728.1 putative serine/threonine-protein kinase iks1 [Ophidiomyces ophidiicola]KAI1922602.1 putative serine/threonine-protein kinase iks1 [Ophidiomyces ophidiicola]KAI1938294.1 putative serine/threonine-protein kinase iks1 [Ophidiomyces ophidiicola]KAI1945781.1 putative serine/threonine-protein kinase iks1 [Ophidiomyces ophidiicola]KAI1953400.1 putative serine/threonine-protein kinase iks1 [Ophidiomyces ophidiicol
MPEPGEQDMSIIPYGSNHDVVLRHNDAIVVFDRASKQLVLQSADPDSATLEQSDCPYCHRPMRDGSENSRDTRRAHAPAPGFINPEYFRMLDSWLPGNTPERSGPPSPRRRLVPPIQPETIPRYDTDTPLTPGISSTAFSEGYFNRFFVEEGILGRGGKGVVLRVQHVLDGVSLGQYACKRVPVGDDHEWLKKVLIEVQLLQRLSHQNLVSYRHVWLENAKLSNFGPSVPCAFILQQFCNSGDLQKYICGAVRPAITPQELKDRLRRKSKGQPDPAKFDGPLRLPFDEIYSFFKDITSGLTFLHENGYIHRDLKPSNCLLHETGRELRALVSDFGEVQSENMIRNSTGSTGTVSYCAPEVLRRVSADGPFGNFTFKSDVFSLGMILYFLCFAQLPYRNADAVDEDKEDLDQLRVEISQWAGFDDARRMRPELPEKLYSFLKRLLSVNPNERPTADEVLSGIQGGVGVPDGRRYHRNGSVGPELRSNSLALPSDTSISPKARRSSLDLTPRLAPPRHSPSYGTNNEPSEIERPSDQSIPEMANEHRSPETPLLIQPSPGSANPVSIHSVPNHQRLHLANQLLLPPPARFPLLRLLRYRLHSRYFTVALTFLKVFSISRPCSPLAVNQWIFYPLLIIAVADLTVTKLWVRVFMLLIHIVVVFVAFQRGVLCYGHGLDYAG